MKVSIVIPTYKRVDYLKRLLDSVRLQTFSDYEVIIVDDCSPNWDEYLSLFGEYQQFFKEFRYFQNPSNSGAPTSRNLGISKAKYDFVALVDDDDEWRPTKLEKQLPLFADDSVGLVYTWADALMNNEIVYRYQSNIAGIVTSKLFSNCFIPSPSVIVRKSAIIEANLFDVTFPSCQDWDMWCRIALEGYEFAVLKEPVTIYHKHDGESIGLSPKALKGYYMFYKKHFWQLVRYAKFKHLYRFFRLGVKFCLKP